MIEIPRPVILYLAQVSVKFGSSSQNCALSVQIAIHDTSGMIWVITYL